MEDCFSQNKGELLICLPEEVDHHNAEEIRRRADRFLSSGYISRIVFDFSKTVFMDSSGIGVIMGRYKQISFMGGRMELIHVNDRIDRLLRMAGIYKLIEIKED